MPEPSREAREAAEAVDLSGEMDRDWAANRRIIASALDDFAEKRTEELQAERDRLDSELADEIESHAITMSRMRCGHVAPYQLEDQHGVYCGACRLTKQRDALRKAMNDVLRQVQSGGSPCPGGLTVSGPFYAREIREERDALSEELKTVKGAAQAQRREVTHLGDLLRHWKKRYREEQSRAGKLERERDALRDRVAQLEALLPDPYGLICCMDGENAEWVEQGGDWIERVDAYQAKHHGGAPPREEARRARGDS